VSGGGGGSGAYSEHFMTVTPGNIYTVTIGAGGTAGTGTLGGGQGGDGRCVIVEFYGI
jgi:hypothetical protein